MCIEMEEGEARSLGRRDGLKVIEICKHSITEPAPEPDHRALRGFGESGDTSYPEKALQLYKLPPPTSHLLSLLLGVVRDGDEA